MTGPYTPKILLATLGTLGDIYPFIALAKAIAARGLRPVIAAPTTHRNAILRESVPFAPIRPSMAEICDALGTDVAGAYRQMLANPHFILDEIYLRFLNETFADVRAAAAGAAAIVSHSLLVGAHVAAETLDVPCARVGLAPLHLQSATRPSLTPLAPYRLEPRTTLMVWHNRVVRRAVRASVDLRMGRLHAFRRSLGLPRTREDLFLDFGRANAVDRIFGLYSPHLAPKASDQSSNLEIVGFPFFSPADATRQRLDANLEAFLAAGPPPVVFTLGSFAPEVSGRFYEVSLQAARRLGLRAVLLAGEREAARLAGRADAGTHVRAEAPHAFLFPRARCVVHHGGIGTTGEALRAALPQIVVPFFGDQPDNARRVERLGTGRSIPLRRYETGRVVDALTAVSSRTYADAARAAALAMQGERGAEAVADWAVAATGFETEPAQHARGRQA